MIRGILTLIVVFSIAEAGIIDNIRRIFDIHNETETKYIDSAVSKTRSNGHDVYQRDVYEKSTENIERMERGNAPIGYDGSPVELHHIQQKPSGELLEIQKSEHKRDYDGLHPYTN